MQENRNIPSLLMAALLFAFCLDAEILKRNQPMNRGQQVFDLLTCWKDRAEHSDPRSS